MALGSSLDELCTNQESAQISDDGETVLVSANRIDDGSSVPIILGVSNGSVITLDSNALQQADSALAESIISVVDARLSADGRFVVATVIASDEPVTNGQTFNFIAGTVIADTRNGNIRVIGLNDYQRFACQNCTLNPVIAPAISGNGQFIVYEQAPEIQVQGEPPAADTSLFRFDLGTDQTVNVRSGPLGISELVVSDNGARVAWRVGGDIQISYLGSNEIVSLQEAFQFCNDGANDCLFATARFITRTAIELSGDGSALTIYLIPQETLNASANDRPELLHFDLNTGTLSRVSPGTDGLFTALSDDGDSVALVGVDNRGVETITVLRRANEQ